MLGSFWDCTRHLGNVVDLVARVPGEECYRLHYFDRFWGIVGDFGDSVRFLVMLDSFCIFVVVWEMWVSGGSRGRVRTGLKNPSGHTPGIPSCKAQALGATMFPSRENIRHTKRKQKCWFCCVLMCLCAICVKFNTFVSCFHSNHWFLLIWCYFYAILPFRCMVYHVAIWCTI